MPTSSWWRKPAFGEMQNRRDWTYLHASTVRPGGPRSEHRCACSLKGIFMGHVVLDHDVGRPVG